MTEARNAGYQAQSDDLVDIFTDLSEVIEHIATAGRHQVETRLRQPALSPAELRVVSRLLRDPGTSISDMANPFFPSSGLVRAAQSLARKGLIEVSATSQNAESVRYVTTAAATHYRDAMRDYRSRCFRYALTAVSASDRAELERLAPALRAYASALGYREPADEPGPGPAS